MGSDKNAEKIFDEWMGELDGYSYRWERFCDDCNRSDIDSMKKWLITAIQIGYEYGN